MMPRFYTKVKRALVLAGLCLATSNFVSATTIPATKLIRDMAGRMVHVPVKIQSVYANNHCDLLLYAIDPNMAVNRITRISDAASRFFTRQYLAKPLTNPQGSMEEIISLHPDVILWSVEVNAKAIEEANRLQARVKIPVVLVELNMLRYKQTFAFLGQLLSRQQKAMELNAFVVKYLDAIYLKTRQINLKQKVRVYYAESPDGLCTEPSGSKHSQILDFIGAVNIAKVPLVIGTGLAKVSIEQLLLWQPDIILVWSVNADQRITYNHILSDPLWQNIHAVKCRKIYQIPWFPFGWFDRPPGPNRILGTIWTAHLLYPALFNFNIIKVTQDYFRKFYHINLTSIQAQSILTAKPQK